MDPEPVVAGAGSAAEQPAPAEAQGATPSAVAAERGDRKAGPSDNDTCAYCNSDLEIKHSVAAWRRHKEHLVISERKARTLEEEKKQQRDAERRRQAETLFQNWLEKKKGHPVKKPAPKLRKEVLAEERKARAPKSQEEFKKWQAKKEDARTEQQRKDEQKKKADAETKAEEKKKALAEFEKWLARKDREESGAQQQQRAQPRPATADRPPWHSAQIDPRTGELVGSEAADRSPLPSPRSPQGGSPRSPRAGDREGKRRGGKGKGKGKGKGTAAFAGSSRPQTAGARVGGGGAGVGGVGVLLQSSRPGSGQAQGQGQASSPPSSARARQTAEAQQAAAIALSSGRSRTSVTRSEIAQAETRLGRKKTLAVPPSPPLLFRGRRDSRERTLIASSRGGAGSAGSKAADDEDAEFEETRQRLHDMAVASAKARRAARLQTEREAKAAAVGGDSGWLIA